MIIYWHNNKNKEKEEYIYTYLAEKRSRRLGAS